MAVTKEPLPDAVVSGKGPLSPGGIFKNSTNGIFDAVSPGQETPAPTAEERRTTVSCDEPGCQEQRSLIADVQAFSFQTTVDVPIHGWLKMGGKDYCPSHAAPHRDAAAFQKKLEEEGGFDASLLPPDLQDEIRKNWARAAQVAASSGNVNVAAQSFAPPNGRSAEPLDLDAELTAAELAAGIDTQRPSTIPPPPPRRRPDRFPPITGGWFAIIVILVLLAVGLALYAQTLREQIRAYEMSLSINNVSSFEHNSMIQRLECHGYEVRQCAGLIVSDAGKFPARYICDSTHCTFECAK